MIELIKFIMCLSQIYGHVFGEPMRIHNLEDKNTVINYFTSELRDINIQNDPMRFRNNIERIGQMLSYEISQTLSYSKQSVTTPLGVKEVNLIDEKLVVASILRAGLPLHNGVLSVFDRAENCFVSAYRKYRDANNFTIHVEYLVLPELDDKTVILCDPMLATGSSMEVAYNAILSKSKPKRVIICSIVASEQALDYINKTLGDKVSDLFVATVDPSLDAHSYIVPGIGDAGDLAFGAKLD
ncbi:uracil phosphoribosyltransferase [Anaerobiospirillum thomasii]|uniref:uracil phosphoribosyltransferase n=1 Tax=Anaerobiospirillum thomasii TaxID=179995 RepID=UPI001C49AE77|nr:uracil phosphoribosyltransferase [Anaerobiospirillum thomasii]